MLPSEPPCSRTSRRRPKLLLVDDDPAIVRGLWRILSRCRPDFQVNAAAGAGQALEALSEHAYDVVITDLQMPGGGGAAVLSALKALYPETARIVHSSQLESSDTFQVCQAAHVVLAKPASEAAIVAAIDLALRSVAAESARQSANS